MGNFLFNALQQLSTSDGAQLASKTDNGAGNSKVLMDQIIGPGPVSLTLTTQLASLTSPSFILLVADGTGFRFNIDSLGLTTKAYTSLGLGISPTPTGTVSLIVELQGGAQRFRMLATGL